MLRFRYRLVLLVLAAAALLGAGAARSRVAAARPATGYQEILYAPNGSALKILACGFDAPLADALWLRCLLYFSDNLRAYYLDHDPSARFLYLHKLCTVITRLTPRFGRAYLYGGMFLLATGREENNRQGIDLLNKGIDRFHDAEATGRPMTPDLRWMMHIQIAIAYEGRFGDRLRAREHFVRALNAPGCPEAIVSSYEGFLEQERLGQGVEERVLSRIRMWESMLAESRGNEALRLRAEARLRQVRGQYRAIRTTRAAEVALTEAVRAYRARTESMPRGVRPLLEAGDLAEPPSFPLPGDRPVLLPDGEARSLVLARMEARGRYLVLQKAIQHYFEKHRNRPPSLDALVEAGWIDRVPRHPLAAVGGAFVYDAATGALEVRDPFPETPGAEDPPSG